MQGRNRVIDLWRIVFVLIIVAHHGRTLVGVESAWFGQNGNMAVEFFFILSGFLMCRSIEKEWKNKGKSERLADDTICFLKRKFLPIYPYFLFTFFVLFIEYAIHQHKNFLQIIEDFLLAIPELLLIRMGGWRTDFFGYNGVAWYLSAMFIVMFVFYPLMRNHLSFFCKVVSPLLAIILIGYMMQTSGTIIKSLGKYEFFTVEGIKRAIAEICCGCIAFEISKCIAKGKNGVFRGSFLSVVEILGYGLVVCICGGKLGGEFSPIVVILLTSSIAITFSGRSILCEALNTILPKSKMVQEFSLSLFLSHFSIRFVFLHFVQVGENIGPTKSMLIYLTASCINAIVVLCIIRALQRIKHPIVSEPLGKNI